MAKPAHCRVVFEGVTGSLAAPVEHWSFGVNFPADAIDEEGNATVDNGVAAALKDKYVTTVNTQMPVDVILTKVKVSKVLATGHVATRADGSYVQGEWVGTASGPGPKQGVPLQTALCISLKTLRSGPTGKGRMFWPFPSSSINVDDKRISAQDAATFATTAKNFLNGLATVMTFPPQIVSSKGYMTAVTGVRVGRVPDTMRSRREDAPEGYVDLPLA